MELRDLTYFDVYKWFGWQEEIYQKMIKLQKKLADDKQCLELEIEQIRRDHREAQEKIEAREEKLKEIGDKIEYLVDAT